MKTEITDKMIENACKCNSIRYCGNCSIYENERLVKQEDCIEFLAKALQEERAERKAMHDVWQDAYGIENKQWDGIIDWESRPWATEVRIAYCAKDTAADHICDRIATIKRPKSKERLIAEKYFNCFENIVACEKALLEAKAGEKC